MIFSGKKILVGISGGIAAYKTCYLIRSIKRQGGEVKTIITRAGEHFITPVTLEALSGEQVARDLFDPVPSKTIQHIDLAQWPDCFVVAPATANIIAKTVHGIADDLLSTVILSCSGPVLFAPAMNDVMWENPVTQNNIKLLKKYRHNIIGPESGSLACDSVGTGRMVEPDVIEQEIISLLGLKKDFAGKRILVTAGGTEEEIDPVRVISNRSSGRMGVALAEASAARGAGVTLIAGSVSFPLPGNADIIRVRSAAEMAKAVRSEIGRHDILLMSAAVADYRPVRPSKSKVKKDTGKRILLELEPTEDILKSLGKKRTGKVIVGFALETDNEIRNARKKLQEKDLDLIVLNNPLIEGAGFETDTNKVTFLEKRKKPVELPVMSKRDVADRILDRAAVLMK
ncbi:bifunctional phosphopantothenoylcysteine decarboxylase/phosphopantothenate--cysteine ligase CoaBC [candidate division KSB1 bacterium]